MQMLHHTVALYVFIQSGHHRPFNNALVPMQVRYLASAFHYESILQVFAFFIRRLQVRLFYELQTDHIAENLYI